MKARIILTIMLLGLIPAAVAFSEETKEVRPKTDPQQLKTQTHCPVMGGEIDSTMFADIQGQRIYFCCLGCIDKFKENPDKYFKKSAEDSILFENIQASCPVSGEKIDKAFFFYYEGRGIYFCCEKCVDTFKSDPKKYLDKLDKETGKTKEEKSTPSHKHGKHDH